jgi:hypothetical protein
MSSKDENKNISSKSKATANWNLELLELWKKYHYDKKKEGIAYEF